MAVDRKSSGMAGKSSMQLSFIYRPIAGSGFLSIAVEFMYMLYAMVVSVVLQPEIKEQMNTTIIYNNIKR